MPRIDYWTVELAIQTILQADAALVAASAFIADPEIPEPESSEQTPWVGIFLETRKPESRQPLASNTKLRYFATFRLVCLTFGLERAQVMKARDDLIGMVETALMNSPRLNVAGVDKVGFSFLDGGNFTSGQKQVAWQAIGEVNLVCA